jgi:hypothetical protein
MDNQIKSKAGLFEVMWIHSRKVYLRVTFQREVATLQHTLLGAFVSSKSLTLRTWKTEVCHILASCV